ncbi:MAG TPA: TIGR04282 family arsenosugar biosynthesis glycosyltransferase, partial [Chloroflexota bacterium]|nr:TIGR04282 family arsenosugar biosynthesis glycosyltransferase [Chloroflexota bacterium]
AQDGETLRTLLPDGVEHVAQRHTGLEAALREAFAYGFDRGHERVVLVDSDSPTLPLGILRDACTGLEDHDVTIGPSADGGYYLLGLREPHGELFDGIAWSTHRVYEQTLDRAAGLKVRSLQEWYDVDTPEDLRRLEADLAHQPAGTALHTRAVMERLRLHATG